MNTFTDQPERPAWQAPPPPPPAKRPFWKKKRFFIPAGLLILIIAVAPKGSDTADKIKAATDNEPSVSKVVGSETQAGSVQTSATTAKPAEVARQDIQLGEYGFTQLPKDSIGNSYASYGALVKNPNPTTWIAESIDVNISFLDAAGTVIESESNTIAVLAPGQSAALGDTTSVAGAVKMEVKALVNHWEKAESTSFGSFTAQGVKVTPDTFGIKATGTLVSTYAKDLKQVRAVALFRNAKGAVVGGDFTYVDFVPANGRIAFEISSLHSVPGAVKADILAQPSNLTLFAD